ncbi:MAG: DUF4258 domain-containing protein [Patescibacteria group bacterium]|nr:DUF4258 domain-containing protein [Patescibacteria group bacterium]
MNKRITFSLHAQKRVRERGISLEEIENFIKYPDKVERSIKNQKRFLFKKIYFNKKLQKDHLLLIVIEKEDKVLKVITLIDTSKISKYF